MIRTGEMSKRIALGRRMWSLGRGLRSRAHHNINSGSILSTVICCVGSPVSERTARTILSSSYNFNHFYPKLLFLNSSRHFSKSTMSETNGGAPCRQNYHESSEALVNKQINMEMYASYVYMSMAYYFDRDDIAFPGLHKFFKKSSDEEREHAEKLMKYQNSRGGRIVLQPVAKPTNDEWTSPLTAMQAALELEKTVNQTLLDLHTVAGRNGDVHLCDYLETEFLDEQVKSIKELSDFVTQLKRVGSGLGEYIFDKELSE